MPAGVMIVLGILLIVLVATLLVRYFMRGKVGFTSGPNDESDNDLSPSVGYTDKNITITYVYLAGWLMKKDVRDSRNKIQFVHTYLKQYFKVDSGEVGQMMANALKHPVNMRSIANWVNRKMQKASDRTQLMDFLIGMAFEDGDVTQPEYVALVRFAELIGIPPSYLEREVVDRRARMNKQQRDSTMDLLSSVTARKRRAYELLGLKETATEKEIKKAYRNLAMQFHPDKFQHVAVEERNEAVGKFLEIQAAYEFLIETDK